MAHTSEEMAQAARRELKMRERVYPRWVEAKRMTQAKADEEISLMKSISEHFEKLAGGERLI